MSGGTMRRAIGAVAAAAVVAGAVAFAVLRPGGSARVLEAVPGDATALVWVPHLWRFVSGVEGAAKAMGLEAGVTGRLQSLSSQVGVDVTDPKSLAAHGLDPEGGLAVFAEAKGAAPVVALAAKDPGRLDAWLRQVLRGRWARHVAGATRGPVRLTVATGPGHLAAWAFRHRVLVVSEGPGAAARVVRAVTAHRGIGDDPTFRAVRRRLGDPSLVTYGTRRLARAFGLRLPGMRRVALGLTLSRAQVHLAGLATLDPAGRRALAPLADAGGATRLLASVDPEAVAVLRVSFDPAAAWRTVSRRGLPPRLARLTKGLAAAKVDLARDVLPLLGHDAVLDVRLAPAPDLSSGLPSLDPRRTNPFDYLRATVAIPVTDPAKAKARLPAVAEALGPALGATVTPRKVDGQQAFTVTYRLGTGMTFGIVEGELVAAGGKGAFRDALARIQSHAGGYAKTVGDPDAVRRLAGAGGFAGLVDVDTFLSAVHGLPASSLGGGTFGVVARAALDRMTAPLSGLHLVSWSLSKGGGGVVLDARVAFHRQGGGRGG